MSIRPAGSNAAHTPVPFCTDLQRLQAPDSPPLNMAQAAAQVATEAALLGATQPSQPGSQMPSHRSGSVDGSNVMRADNRFSQDDHFFRVRGLLHGGVQGQL